MEDQRILVFTDGAAKGNPGPAGWGVIVATPAGRVTELGGRAARATNNQMELTAPLEALRHLQHTPGRVAIYSDSTYLIKGIRDWIQAWRRRGWTTANGTPVLNRELWEALADQVAARGKAGIAWHHVPGHAGVPGNERVDEIADAFALGSRPVLYDGPLTRYPVQLLDLPDDTRLPRRGATASRSKAPAYTYLSVVDGRPMRHATWAECERRVKGRSGARFKKASSPTEAAEILRAWGFDPGEAQ